jgi:beta-lactamase superfamily II metal-dependent hydrolase
MFRIEMLPAQEGDCLWIEYGPKDALRRILIDTGTPGTYRKLTKKIAELPKDQRRFELFIVSHIDGDHIGGAIRFLEERPEGVEFGDVWFNGYRHLLAASDRLGVKQAQELTKALVDGEHPWNAAFDGGPVMIDEKKDLPVHELDGGMKLTLLSPYRQQLIDLLPEWEKELEKLREKRPDLIDEVAEDRLGARIDVRALAESKFEEDDGVPNGSSIAVLAEYEGRRILFGADAFPSVLERSVDRLLDPTGNGRLALDVFKVCHHGSMRNVSPALQRKLAAKHYLVSTNGARHGHPNREGVARLVYYGEPGGKLTFNYRTDYNRVWDDPLLKKKHAYSTEFPEDGSEGVVVELG